MDPSSIPDAKWGFYGKFNNFRFSPLPLFLQEMLLVLQDIKQEHFTIEIKFYYPIEWDDYTEQGVREVNERGGRL